MQVLKLALRCIIVTQPGSEEIASHLAAKMSPHYRTLTCVVTDAGSSVAAEESHIACVDEHTVQVLLPVCHKALFVEVQPTLATKLVQLAREHKLPAAIFTTGECPGVQSNEAAEPTHGCPVLASVEVVSESATQGMKCSEMSWHTAVEKIQCWIGVPDRVLQCITAGSLKSLHKGDGDTHFKLQPAQRELLDLSTFSKSGATSLTLQSAGCASGADGTEVSSGEAELEQLDALEAQHCTSIANAAQLARHLLVHNHCITQLNLTSVSVSEDTARLLADVLLRNSNSQIEVVVLSKALLPAGRLIGRTSTKAKSNLQPDGTPFQISSMTAVSLSATITDIDVAFMTVLLERTPESTLSSLTISGPLSVPSKLLESFSVAVAKLQNLESFQGVLCHSFKCVNGLLCPTRENVADSRTPDYPLGTLGALVAAHLLEQSWKSSVNAHCPGPDQAQLPVNANTLDGVVDTPCDSPQSSANMELQTINLGGTGLGGLGSERIASALRGARFCSSMHLQLPCTAPGTQGCKAWALFITSHVASCLTALDLSSNNIEDTQMLELSHALGLCTRATPISAQLYNSADMSIVT